MESVKISVVNNISIHAPTRGATSIEPLTLSILAISIHAPTRGATWSPSKSASLITFQSTLPREERLLFRIARCNINNFNPRSHERSDTPLVDGQGNVLEFQSTLPREERPLLNYFIVKSDIFQSTLPREERQQYCTKNLFIFIQYRQ